MVLDYKGIQIFYSVEGSGEAVVLLHGFLENLSMWKDIVPEVSKNKRVICIDLLGHGKTGCLAGEHTMEIMAEAVFAVLNHLKVNKSTIIGHSMGGYVALAYAERYLDTVNGLCLMNSTFEVDDADRKQLRAKANEMVSENFNSMVRISFARLFSEASKLKYKPEFEAALQIALRTSVKSYIKANEGMKNRKDQSSFFEKAPFRKGLILGKKDAVLPYKPLVRFAEKHQIFAALFSEGHMSYIENKTELLNSTMHFIEKI